MKKKVQIILFLFIIISVNTVFSQQKTVSDPDIVIKNEYYTKFKKQVMSFSHKDYDELFFQFLSKSNDSKSILTKEEYYTYTIKIAIYSEKLGLLYKNKKDEANATKQEWFDKNYSDYLTSKK